MDSPHYILHRLIRAGYGPIMQDMSIEVMYIHYLQTVNSEALDIWINKCDDFKKNKFTYPYPK
jgi:hypothetical protein